jgi:hypothetical protein
MSPSPMISRRSCSGLTGWLLAAAISFACFASASIPDADAQWSALTFDLKQRATIQQRAGETLHPASLLQPSDRDPLDVLLRRTGALLDDLKGRVDLTAAATELDALRAEAEKVAPSDPAARRALFDRVLPLRRRIAFANPLLDFKDILFVKRHRPSSSTCATSSTASPPARAAACTCWRAPSAPRPKSATCSPTQHRGQRPPQGAEARGRQRRWQAHLSFDGVRLSAANRPTGGAFLSPALSYDGRSILSPTWSAPAPPPRTSTPIPRAATGTRAAVITFSASGSTAPGSPSSPTEPGTISIPAGCPTVASPSSANGAAATCAAAAPARSTTSTTWRRTAAASTCSASTTATSGVPASRMTAASCGRAGTTSTATAASPTSPGSRGSTAPIPAPCTATSPRGSCAPTWNWACAPSRDRRSSSATAAPHHGQAFGSLIVIDPRVEDDDAMGPVRRLTPEVGFPESQGGHEVYGTPWPLGENYHLCVYEPAANGQPRGGPGKYGPLSRRRLRQQGADPPRRGNRLLQPHSRARDAGPLGICRSPSRPGAGDAGRHGRGHHGRGQCAQHHAPAAGGHRGEGTAHPPASPVLGALGAGPVPDRTTHQGRRGFHRARPLGARHGAGRGRRQRALQGAGQPAVVFPVGG